MTWKYRLVSLVTTAAVVSLPIASAQQVTSYSYDSLGRLIGSTISGGPNSGVVIAITYDAAMNRQSYSLSGAPDTNPTPSPPTSVGAVTNFSFEAPSVGGGYAYGPNIAGTPPGLTFNGSAGIAANGSAFAFPAAPDGTQVAFLQGAADGAGILTQSVGGLSSGASYVIGFRAVGRPGFPAAPITVRVGGVSLGTFTPTSSFSQFVTLVFTATEPTATIEYHASPNSGYTASGIDLVTVTASPSPPPSVETVTSFSFEAPSVGGGYAYGPNIAGTPPGLTFNGSAGIAANGSAFAFPAAPDGTQVAFLQGAADGAGILTQSVGGLSSGASYVIGFRAVGRPGFPAVPITVRVGGVSLGTFTPTSSFSQFVTSVFTATGPTATIEYHALPNGGYTASGIDLVTLTAS